MYRWESPWWMKRKPLQPKQGLAAMMRPLPYSKPSRKGKKKIKNISWDTNSEALDSQGKNSLQYGLLSVTPMLRSRHNVKRLLLIVGDLFVFEAALVITLWIRYGAIENTWRVHALPFSIVAAFWIVGFYIAGLYDLNLLRQPLKLFRTYLEGMIGNFAFAIAFFYLIPIFGIAPRTNLFLHFVISLLLGYAWRLLFQQLIADRFSPGRVLFIGPGEEARHVYELIQQSALGLTLTAALSSSEHIDRTLSIDWLTHLSEVEPAIQSKKINAVVLGVKPETTPELKQVLYRLLFEPVSLLDRAEIEELTTGRIPLSYVSETWFLHHLHESDKAGYETFKRGFDIFLSIPFCILTIVLLPFIALAIKLSAPGPIFYAQTRTGHGGKPIRIWKFRTMILDAEKYGPQFTPSSATDPRVTRVGRFMRQLRIDELPQIWNVLRGDLSLIGPRPERPEFVAPLVERMPYYALRHLTRPGLTGWAQVRFLTPTSSLDDNLKKLQYDLYYIKHRSPLLDIAILLKTVGIVLRRQGT
ncbi:sugar transferase [Candidatus Uhrbacteria bacterium]|nr:sugar transferase [Candidatus Uhrbacteria bacterium]